ncbi:DUF1403 family protein [Pseudotabrizicola sp.]|uniref:DUF1403 family protein n=1 Tax=Pseudotabrizicola sp. TaxID=2939647 RepID=UPI00351EB8B1
MLPLSPRAATTALILGDAVLAHALGRSHLVPSLATGLKSCDLHLVGAALRLACCRAVAPKLQAKGAGQALEMFLTRDAVAAAALVLILSDMRRGRCLAVWSRLGPCVN